MKECPLLVVCRQSSVTHWQRAFAFLLALGAFLQTAYAHPGHAIGEQGLRHVVSSPFHLFVLVSAALCLWCAGWFVKRAISRQLLQLAAATAVLAAAILWSFTA